MTALILFIVAAMPIFLLGGYIYKKDIYKEPLKLIIQLFLGGIFSCFLVIVISGILSKIFPFAFGDRSDSSLLELFVQIFVGVALVEEFCKWIMVYSISYKSKYFDMIYDMLLYSTFVALGFAFFENIIYVFNYGIDVGISRAFLAVPGHTCDGIIMGYYLGLAKQSFLQNQNTLSNRYKLMSIIVPTITHGIYDYFLYIGTFSSIVIFFVFIVFFFVLSYRKLKKISSINRKMKYNNNYCSSCGRIVDSDFCPNCGKKNL